MFSGSAIESRRRLPSWSGPFLVYALSIACLIWVYWDFDWRTGLPKIWAMHWPWVALAVICDIGVYVCQAWRWNLLLGPVARIPLWRSVRAIYIGLFANEALPLRTGEIIRVYLQSHWSRIPFPIAISSALIERLIDGVWIIVGFVLTTFFVRLPDNLVLGAGILGSVVAVLSVLLIFAVLERDQTHRLLDGKKWSKTLLLLVDGLNTMGRSRSFYAASAASMLYLLLQVIPIYAIVRGYGVDLSLASSAVVLVVLRLGTVIPGPPGNIGLFNAFAVLGLTLVGVDRQTAVGLSGVMFFAITVPLLLAGCVALFATGVKIGELHRHAQDQLRSRTPAPTPVDTSAT
ncbi:MAG: lysylphosphatidylglycerol synthase transmembrane domain-containing protein [Bryobacteraceae bacterium]